MMMTTAIKFSICNYSSHRSIVNNLLILSLFLVTTSRLILNTNCQATISSNDTLLAPNNSTSGENITDIDTTTSDELLLSGEEFVDNTETPIILFDGLSSSSEQNKTNNNDNNQTLSEIQAPNITTSITTIAPQIDASTTTLKSIPLSSSTTIKPQITETNTTTTTDIIKSDNNDEENNNNDEEEVGEEEEQDSNHNNNNSNESKQKPFNPPNNVSQYMDYIEQLFHDLRHQITDLFEPHIPQLIRTSQMVQLSSSCSYDMLRLALALRQFEPWALRMIDSSGKVPEGIFEGSFTALGSYDECLSTKFESSKQKSTSSDLQDIQDQPEATTQGKYCLVNVSPYLPPKPPADKVERMFQEEANRRNYTKDDQFSRLSPMFYYMKFRIGVCVPSTCINSDLESISNALSTSLRLNITVPHCKVRQDIPFTNHQLIGGFIFGLVLTMVIVATLLDYSKTKLSHINYASGALGLVNGEIIILDSSGCPKLSSDQSQCNHLDKNNKKQSISYNIPVVFQRRDRIKSAQVDSRESFTSRLNKNWSWMSFSLLTNYKLYFEDRISLIINNKDNNKNRRPTTKLDFQEQESGSQRMKNNPDHQSLMMIRCLDGIRVLSLFWVIIANSYITLDPRATKRLTKTREAPKDFLFQMIAQASLAIETFFFLSGILMSLSFSKKLNLLNDDVDDDDIDCNDLNDDRKRKKKKKVDRRRSGRDHIIKWIHFYVHRYIRMTPATMLVIAFTMFAFRYGDGPLWVESTHKAHLSCSENWWRHLLHVANFIDTRQMCFIHYWYIAADMQLFLFAPILLYLLYRKRKIGYAIAALIGLFSIGNVFYTTYMRNLPPTLLFYNSDPESRREFGNTIMTKPWTHALPYLVGMFVGKWLTLSCSENSHQPSASNKLATQINSKQGQLNRSSGSLTMLFGLVALSVALGEVFLPYKWNNSHLPTRFLAALYAALFRLAWSLALAYLVISCRHQKGRRCRGSSNNNQQQQQNAARCYNCNTTTTNQASYYHPRSDQERNLMTNSESPKVINDDDDKYNNSNTSTKCENNLVSGDPWKSYVVGQFEQTNQQTSGEQTISEANHWCFCGSGGNILNRLLSLNIFNYLSKLSFVAYLIHLPLMSVFIAQTRGLFAFSHSLVIHLALSYLLMTFLLSFILVHIIEFPFLTLERYLFDKFFYSNEDDNERKKTKTDEEESQQQQVKRDMMMSSNSGSKQHGGSSFYSSEKINNKPQQSYRLENRKFILEVSERL